MPAFHSGFVAIVGRPNVGKSTLMNAMIGEKIAIVSNRPQTTRNRIMGVCTDEHSQIVFLDTPGLHTPHSRLGEYMVKAAHDALSGIDALLVMVDATAVGRQDRAIAAEMSGQKVKKALVLNKIDLMPRESLLALMESFSDAGYDDIVPVSARTGDGLAQLRALLVSYLPEGPQYFPPDAVTDQPERLICAELIREKALLFMREEIPHGIAVVVERFKERPDKDLIDIDVDIYCERKSHKGMIIGKGGQMLKKIASAARMDIEELLGVKVNLQCWVKVREDWRDNEQLLNSLGFAKP